MSDETQVPTDAEADAAALALGLDKGAGIDPDSQNQIDPKPAPDGGADDPTPDEVKTEPDNAGEEGKDTEGDGGKPADKKDDGTGGQPKGVKRLLESRNAANVRVKELEEENAKLKAKPEDLGEVEYPSPAEDRPVTMADLERRDRMLEAKQKDAQARGNLLKKMPEAEQFIELVDEVLKQHPTLTDEAALRMVAPNLFVGANAPGNKLDVGGQARSPSRLKADKKPSQKTTAELDKAVEKMEKDGELPI